MMANKRSDKAGRLRAAAHAEDWSLHQWVCTNTTMNCMYRKRAVLQAQGKKRQRRKFKILNFRKRGHPEMYVTRIIMIESRISVKHFVTPGAEGSPL